MPATVSYFEIPTQDPAAAATFYGSLFGWEIAEDAIPGYAMIDGDAGGIASGEVSTAPRIFFTVPDAGVALATVVELGGTAADPVTIPSGTLVRCTDDQGVAFTLWEQA